MRKAIGLSFGRMLAMASCFLLGAGESGALAQSEPELRTVNNQFKTEAGCPVQLVSAKTDLEIDPIGTPMACRIYIDYKNNSTKTISGVKFRIGYIDAEEKIRGSFHAPDGHVLEPGGTAKGRWRGDKVDPRTSYVLIRVLVARYSDGSTWESEKMKELAPGTGGSGSGAGAGAATTPANQTLADSDKSSSSSGAVAGGASAPSSSGGDSFDSSSPSAGKTQPPEMPKTQSIGEATAGAAAESGNASDGY